jgi:primase-polymerase (primpol)-like protein
VYRDGRWTKPPIDPVTGHRARSNDPNTWATFDATLASARRWHLPGIGFVVTRQDPYIGIDIDRCRDPETGNVEHWASDIIAQFGSYTEVTPSSAGVRVWIRVEGQRLLPDGSAGRRNGAVEIYGTGRFFTVTGHPVGATAVIEERTEQLAVFCTEIFGTAKPVESPQVSKGVASPRSDADIIKQARSARNGHKFVRLFDHGDSGEFDHDDSRADQALVSLLAFWTQDPSQLDRLFRRSALYRDKWERSDYRERTIGKALANRVVFRSSPRIVRPVHSVFGKARVGSVHIG